MRDTAALRYATTLPHARLAAFICAARDNIRYASSALIKIRCQEGVDARRVELEIRGKIRARRVSTKAKR